MAPQSHPSIFYTLIHCRVAGVKVYPSMNWVGGGVHREQDAYTVYPTRMILLEETRAPKGKKRHCK